MDDMLKVALAKVGIDPCRFDRPVAVESASRKWTMRYRDWSMIYSQSMIFFEDRVANLDYSQAEMAVAARHEP